MSKGLGKVQLAILDKLKHENQGEGYKYAISELKEAIKASQQSLNRSINGLIDKGLVIRTKNIGWGLSVNSWVYEYMLIDNAEKHEEYLIKKGEKLKADDLKARQLGYDNHQDYLLATMFK